MRQYSKVNVTNVQSYLRALMKIVCGRSTLLTTSMSENDKMQSIRAVRDFVWQCNKSRLQGAFGAGRRNRRPSLKRYVLGENFGLCAN